MRTNIELDAQLVAQGLKMTGIKTKKDLVNTALFELVQRKNQKKILQLRGKIAWQGNLDLLRQSRV